MEPQPPAMQAPAAPWRQGPSPFDPPPPHNAAPADEPHFSRTVLAAVAGGIALLLAAVWAVGGLNPRPTEPPGKAGEPINQSRFTVTIRDARIATIDKKRWIVVRMRIVNHGNETAVLSSPDGLAGGVAALTKFRTYVKPDEVDGLSAGSEVMAVQPGLPVEAAARWELGASQPPQRFTVALRNWSWHGGFGDATLRWWADNQKGDALVARIPLQVAPE